MLPPGQPAALYYFWAGIGHAGGRMKIAVLGIGLMGYPMVRRLCEAGHEVHAWNRTAERAQRLVSLGASAHRNPREAVRHAGESRAAPSTALTGMSQGGPASK